MKILIHSLILLASLILGICPSSAAAQAFSAIIPIHPGDLLKAMPKTPDNWKIQFSRGQNFITESGVPVSQAIRRYEITIEDLSVSPPVSKIVKCNILLMDVGSKAEDAKDFTSRLTRADNENASHKRLDADKGTRGVFNINPSGGIQYDGICGNRLILEIEVSGATEKEFVSLFQSADFSALSLLSSNLPDRKSTSRIFTLHIADEMNPKLNRSYQGGTIDPEAESNRTIPEPSVR